MIENEDEKIEILEDTSPSKGDEDYRPTKELKADFSYLNDKNASDRKSIPWLAISIIGCLLLIIIVLVLVLYFYYGGNK